MAAVSCAVSWAAMAMREGTLIQPMGLLNGLLVAAENGSTSTEIDADLKEEGLVSPHPGETSHRHKPGLTDCSQTVKTPRAEPEGHESITNIPMAIVW